MAIERTLSIIKPDAVAKNVIGAIYSKFEQDGLRIVASRMLHLSAERAGAFYAVHKERPFFGELIEFMTSGPVLLMVLEGENAVAKNRELMGATNPADAAEERSAPRGGAAFASPLHPTQTRTPAGPGVVGCLRQMKPTRNLGAPKGGRPAP